MTKDMFDSFSVAELMAMDLPELKYIIDDILPECCTSVLAAPAKMGKSWFTLSLAIAVSTGTPFLGLQTCKSGVIYFALEDSKWGLKERFDILHEEASTLDNLRIVLEPENATADFFKKIEAEMIAMNNPKLIIIDTLQKVNMNSKGKSDYADGYDLLSPFTNFAKQKQISFILVHHTKKDITEDGDPFNDILGSTAYQSAVDNLMVFRGDRETKKNVKLHITGKYIKHVPEFTLDFDAQKCIWINNGTSEDILFKKYENNPIVITIKSLLDLKIKDSISPQNELAITISELQKKVHEYTGEPISDKPRRFSTKVSQLDNYLTSIGIVHTADTNTTTINNVSGKYHRFYYG